MKGLASVVQRAKQKASADGVVAKGYLRTEARQPTWRVLEVRQLESCGVRGSRHGRRDPPTRARGQVRAVRRPAYREDGWKGRRVCGELGGQGLAGCD